MPIVLEAWISLGIVGVVIATLLYLYATDKDRFERYVRVLISLFGRLCRFFWRQLKWAGGYFRRKNMSIDITSRINEVARFLNREAPQLATYGIKLKWVKPEKEGSANVDMEDGEVILVLREDSSDTNFAKAVSHYVELGAIPRAGLFFDDDLKDAVDLKITDKILAHFDDRYAAYEHFVNHILHPKISENETQSEFYSMLKPLDSHGIFTRIYLNEVIRLIDKQTRHNFTHDSIIKTNRNLVRFLYDISTRGKEEKGELEFPSGWFDVGITLVGRSENLREKNYDAYLNSIGAYVERGIRSIYVLAFDTREGFLAHKDEPRADRTDPIAFANQVANLGCKRFPVKRRNVKDQVYMGVVRDEMKYIICIPLVLEPCSFSEHYDRDFEFSAEDGSQVEDQESPAELP